MTANTDTADATHNDLDRDALHGRIVELDNSTDALVPFSPLWVELSTRETQLRDLVEAGCAESAMFQGSRLLLRITRMAESTESATQVLLAGCAKDAWSDLLKASVAGKGRASWNLGLMHEMGLGTQASNLAAAEWFGMAAYQFFVAGDMSQAG